MCRAGVNQGTDGGSGYGGRQLQCLDLVYPSDGVERDLWIDLRVLHAEAVILQLQQEYSLDRADLQVLP
jgi:hypothetical protein